MKYKIFNSIKWWITQTKTYFQIIWYSLVSKISITCKCFSKISITINIKWEKLKTNHIMVIYCQTTLKWYPYCPYKITKHHNSIQTWVSNITKITITNNEYSWKIKIVTKLIMYGFFIKGLELIISFSCICELINSHYLFIT